MKSQAKGEVGRRPMNVQELRRALAHLPGEMLVAVEDSSMGWMQNAALYVAPAHVDRRVSGNYLYACHHERDDNRYALLISGLHQSDETVVAITPEPARSQLTEADHATHRTKRKAARRSDELARRRGRHA
jgi:hypothetical protein